MEEVKQLLFAVLNLAVGCYQKDQIIEQLKQELQKAKESGGQR